MKSNKIQPEYKCLIYDKFNAQATIEEVKNFFAIEGILVFSMIEIENEVQK